MTQDNSANNKRIVKNTFLLYIRSIVIMAVSFFTSRVVLQTLGITDYGIHNVVGGFVGMFSMVSSSLVSASQRFISFEMGKQNPQMNKVFCGTVSIHILLAAIMLILFETLGLWFLNNKLIISTDRLIAANWVFQFSVLTFCINIISTPYNACIVAHEKMSTFAYISVYEAFAKLGIVYLIWICSFDRLIVYSFLLLCIALSVRILYGAYCSKHFEECKFKFHIDSYFYRSLLSFSGWNFLGSTANVLITQGINILSNLFFGVNINAARGLVDHVNNAVNQFVSNFMTALNPQITQSYSSCEYERMNILMFRGSKYATLLYWMLGLILFVEADFLLDIWLVSVPEYSTLFLRMIIVFSIFQAMSGTLYIGVLATGKIKIYQILMCLLYLGAFILCYIFFRLGMGPEYGYVSMIIAVMLAVLLRLKLIERMIPFFSTRRYVLEVILRVVPVVLISSIIAFLTVVFFHSTKFLEFALILFISLLILPVLTFLISMDKDEKDSILFYLQKHLFK